MLSVLPAVLTLFGFIFRGRQLLPVSDFGRQPVWSKNSNILFYQSLRSHHGPILILHFIAR